MRVLITGATGLLGSHLCRRMVADGHEVRILARATSDLTRLEGLPVERVTGDVTDRESVESAVKDREWVIHAAARIGEGERDEQMRVNVTGSGQVARSCRMAGV